MHVKINKTNCVGMTTSLRVWQYLDWFFKTKFVYGISKDHYYIIVPMIGSTITT